MSRFRLIPYLIGFLAILIIVAIVLAVRVYVTRTTTSDVVVDSENTTYQAVYVTPEGETYDRTYRSSPEEVRAVALSVEKEDVVDLPLPPDIISIQTQKLLNEILVGSIDLGEFLQKDVSLSILNVHESAFNQDFDGVLSGLEIAKEKVGIAQAKAEKLKNISEAFGVLLQSENLPANLFTQGNLFTEASVLFADRVLLFLNAQEVNLVPKVPSQETIDSIQKLADDISDASKKQGVSLESFVKGVFDEIRSR